VDVLQVAHHGSEDPGLPDVLARLDATVALVSAGRGNQFGHPRAATLSALGAAGARVLRTDMGGDIDVSPGRGGIVVRQG
jgi:competence protein ComEC